MRNGMVAVVTALALAVLIGAPAAAQERIALPAPAMTGGMPLMEALAQRQSTRAFAERPLDDQTLSNLLWAAYGINRPDSGDHTAPSWRGSKETDIHVVRPDGVWLYEPAEHALRQLSAEDLREETGRAPFAATAPLVLVYVADRARMAEAAEEDQRLYAHVDAAFVSQNVYLFAASEGLATVVLGNVDRPVLAERLGLRDDQVLTFTQPVGYPR